MELLWLWGNGKIHASWLPVEVQYIREYWYGLLTELPDILLYGIRYDSSLHGPPLRAEEHLVSITAHFSPAPFPGKRLEKDSGPVEPASHPR